MSSVAPGTYRIINVKAGMAMTISEGGEGYVFCWQRHDGLVQQWQVERSGDRYRFKNCGTGQWLSVPNPENAIEACAGRHPVSWNLDQQEQDHDSYMIRFQDYNRVLDLDGWGADFNGNNVHMSADIAWMPHRSWKFEKLGDEPREEDQRLHKQIAERDHRLVEKDQQMVEKDHQLTEMADRLAAPEQVNGEDEQDGKQVQGPENLNSEPSSQPRSGHNDYSDDSGEGPALRRANDTIKDRDITILTLQNQLLREKSEKKTSDVEKLREKVETLETRLGESEPSGQNAA